MKNIDFIVKKTANDLNISEEIVRPFIDKYFKLCYDKMVLGKIKDDDTTIFLRNIGLFTISRYKLNNHIVKKISKIKGMMKSNKYTDEVKKEYVQKQKTRLTKALKHRNIIAKEYAEIFGNV